LIVVLLLVRPRGGLLREAPSPTICTRSPSRSVKCGPAGFVVFGHAVLQRPDREPFHHLRVAIDQVGAGQPPAAEQVVAVGVELRGGRVQGERHFVACRFVPGGGDGGDEVY